MQLKETKAAAKELLSELPIKKPRKLKRSARFLLPSALVSDPAERNGGEVVVKASLKARERLAEIPFGNKRGFRLEFAIRPNSSNFSHDPSRGFFGVLEIVVVPARAAGVGFRIADAEVSERNLVVLIPDVAFA